MFKVPPGIYHDRELQLKLSTLVKDLLTNTRSHFKVKIGSSEEKKLNIGELTRLLAPSGIEITSAHWGRVAFLRQSLKHFKAMNSKKHETSDQTTASIDGSQVDDPDDDNALDDGDDLNPLNPDDSNADMPDQTGETPSQSTQPWTYREWQFWNYVDDELANLRKLVREETSSTSDADARTTEFFTHSLKTDLKEYPGQTIRRADAVIPGWQTSLHEKLIW